MTDPSRLLTLGTAAVQGDGLYESATTRVFRLGDASATDGMVCKEYLGTHADQRLRHEKDMLARLAGIEGVAQLDQETHRAGVLTLRDGGTPLARLLRDGPLELSALLSLAPRLAEALASVHRAGIIHRDINPANILLSKAGEPMLIDFDLAMLAQQHLAVAHDSQIVGALGYVAPEQTGRTGRAVDQRADLYALGATLYEMATGRPPFEDDDTLQLIHDHLVREPMAPSQVDQRVPSGLSEIILRLLAKAPEQRYQSAYGLLHDLARLRGELEQGLTGVFELGQRDFSARLAAPARLVGRDAELAMLRIAFTDALRTPRRTVLVEGAAGVGKSALINELRPVVAAKGGWFVLGKFDQYQKDGATAGALTQALRALGRLLLAEAGDELASQRQRILDDLGRGAGLMTRLLPEFALLLGPQPEVPEVDPQHAELRLQQAMVDLLCVIVTPERPLVMVLDDLQWAEALSLRVLERLMNEPALRGLLLVGAYRGKEIDPAHVLSPMLLRWNQQAEALLHMELHNLNPTGMSELIGQMLRLPHQHADALAKAVGVLTAGNPFDTVEIVNTLRHEGVLSLAAQGWQWDSLAIRRFVGQSSVIDLLAARIARLPAASQLLVQYMSCLGASVEHELLQVAADLNADELREQLRAPLEDGLLAADPNGLAIAHFRHDRVQQAVLGGLDETRRAQCQLEMARRLAQLPSLHRYAAQQYLGCAANLREPHEARRVAQLFHDTAARLIKAANPALAERFLAAAETLLATLDDPHDASLRCYIDMARHAALYSLGRLDEADAFHARAQANAADPLDLVEPTCLQMRSVYIRGRMRDALDLGLALLERLGLAVPPGFADPTMAQRLDALAPWVLQERALDPAQRPPIQDRHLLGIANLLSRAYPPAFFLLDTKALVWLTLECQRLWAAHGPCEALVVALSRACMVLVLTRQDYRTGFDIARHVLAVAAAHGLESETSEGRHVFTISASHWFEPLEDTFRHSMRAREGFAQQGDSSYSSFTYFVASEGLLECEPTLDSCAAEIATGMDLGRRSGNNLAATLIRFEQQLLRSLRGQTLAPGSFNEAQFDEQVFRGALSQPPVVRITYHVRRALAAALFDDLPGLAEHSAAAMPLLDGTPGFYLTAHAHMLRALAIAWQMQAGTHSMTADGRTILLAELNQCRSWLAGRAADQPHNFLHLLRLVEAEEAWAADDPLRAMALFDTAMDEAQARQRPWHKALITERAARFHLARQWIHTGRSMLARARDMYDGWGASAKVRHMQQAHPFLQPVQPELAGRANTPSSTDTLDLVGVLRASQALSSETGLERLTARVTEVLAALSGATQVLVLSWNEDQWWLLAPTPGESSIPVTQAAERGLLSLSAVRYVERTQEPLLVDDAPRDDRFLRDPYFAGVPLCSLLVAPIASQGTTRAMLLLENRLGRAAFNAQRLDAVMLIAGQLAVSLANAQLYESLEQRVQARTRELEHTQAQLVTTARRAGMAEIATNVLHNVGNVLNSVNVSASVVRRTISESSSQGLARAVEVMNQHAGDLGHFIDSDPRGKVLLAYLNELVGALRTERDNTLSDLDRLSRSVDHITYVVAAQQSHAGSSSVHETAQIQELLEEALRLSAEAIARSGVTVVRRYEDVPVIALDKQRLVQVLVNLIGNAAQAMEGLPEPSRLLTLAAAVLQGDSGEYLRITVQDEGEGIAPENLTRIFAHGFTTRQSGHGFGLHSSALAVLEMGGRLTAHSEGAGQGAVFTLELPMTPRGES